MCMADYSDFTVQILQDKWCKAKKNHRCYECGRQITAGEQYYYEAMVGDGFGVHKTCQHCYPSRKLLIKHCRSFVYGSIFEDLQDHIHTPWGMQAARFSLGMKRKWKSYKHDGLLPLKAGQP